MSLTPLSYPCLFAIISLMEKSTLLKHFESHPHWFAVSECVKTLIKHGYKAYLAGGCVRDALIGRPINDFDLATDALPSQMLEIFENSIDHAAHFGVVAVPYTDTNENKFLVEITRFRWDKAYENGRHPSEIEFKSEKEDAKRRDFSMNSLFFDLYKGTIIDFTGGKDDINKKVIKAVGIPIKRFKEDRLRILRAVRFQSQLGFDIDPKTLLAIQYECKHIEMISKERVFTELKKIISGQSYLDAFNSMYSSGLFEIIFKSMKFSQPMNWEEFKIDFHNIGEQTIESFFTLITVYELRDIQGSVKEDQIKKLVSFYKTIKVPSKVIKDVQNITTLYFDFGLHNLVPSIKVFESKHNSLFFKLLNSLGKKNEFIKIREIYKKNLDSVSHLAKPFINGRDCLSLEIKPFEIGNVLDIVYEKQLLGLIINKQESLAFVKNLKTQMDI